MKILAFAASNSRSSINKRLVTHATEVFQSDVAPHAEIEILDLNDFEIPIYSADREAEGGVPELAKQFHAKIGAADALLISYAEHNGHYTAVWKNLFDWMSRIDKKVFQDKPAVIMSASAGGGGGANVMAAAKESAGFFGAEIKGSFSVGPFAEKFDAEAGRLTDPALNRALLQSLSDLDASI
ncbi:NAD(P)H-dependent FMN reductase [Litoreibacter ascidiaceicola]|uniref:NAD(P)H-dependent FMN reductase n=1 Tax=Litoreibacter ascidiaceicola TaxID=1486859 RepID=A0A1M4Z2E2_9RHOB|nr:NAD(P)H-dependent oxidoreductase [Litoreibacter ascidiaceicola]SHF12211.1 NAD(P)H-dependent FMN reductase [Litoreibacter ascidiaceicola]